LGGDTLVDSKEADEEKKVTCLRGKGGQRPNKKKDHERGGMPLLPGASSSVAITKQKGSTEGKGEKGEITIPPESETLPLKKA